MTQKNNGAVKIKPLFLATLALGSVVAMLITSLGNPSQAQNDSERVVEFQIPKHVPIKVKLKKEKEKAIKDLRNATWYQDFQLEVTNTSASRYTFWNCG